MGTQEQAYEAARQFGKFTKVLSGVDASKLKTTIPSFHDLTLRYTQAIKTGNTERIAQAKNYIEQVQQFS